MGSADVATIPATSKSALTDQAAHAQGVAFDLPEGTLTTAIVWTRKWAFGHAWKSRRPGSANKRRRLPFGRWQSRCFGGSAYRRPLAGPPHACFRDPSWISSEALPARPAATSSRTRTGAVLYVGKAKSLRSRVRSYFQDSAAATSRSSSRSCAARGDLETIVTATEKEAAILENSLIKEHKPRFNVKLRDDKEFLSLRLDRARLAAARAGAQAEQDSARYFGPYHSATARAARCTWSKALSSCAPAPTAESRAASGPAWSTRSSAAWRPASTTSITACTREQVRAVALFMDGRHDELTRRAEDAHEGAPRETRVRAGRDLPRSASRGGADREEQRVVAVSDMIKTCSASIARVIWSSSRCCSCVAGA